MEWGTLFEDSGTRTAYYPTDLHIFLPAHSGTRAPERRHVPRRFFEDSYWLSVPVTSLRERSDSNELSPTLILFSSPSSECILTHSSLSVFTIRSIWHVAGERVKIASTPTKYIYCRNAHPLHLINIRTCGTAHFPLPD